MKQSMNVFGRALYGYHKGDRDRFYFIDQKGKKYPWDLKRYFRNYRQLSGLEKRIISLSYGNILDVGCGPGYYIPSLMKRGRVIGIDISEIIIRITKERGLKNCKVADIFKFKTRNKFDTITLLENNLGMGETLSGAKRLLRMLSSLLKENGQILTISKRIRKKDFFINLCSEINSESCMYLKIKSVSVFPIFKEYFFPKKPSEKNAEREHVRKNPPDCRL